MTIKAHRIVKVEYAPYPSFNLYHDQKLAECLDIHPQLTDSGGGVVTVDCDDLRAAISKAAELELDEDTVKALTADLKAAEDNGDTSIDYDCY